MAVRYKYQLVQALDEKIGRDLRGLVEGYLGPDPDKVRADRGWAEAWIRYYVQSNTTLKMIKIFQSMDQFKWQPRLGIPHDGVAPRPAHSS